MRLMAEVHEHEFTSVSDFFSFIPEKLITRDHNYGFRGHACDLWKLEPTLARFLDRIELAFPERRNDRVLTTKIVLKKLHDEFRKNLIMNNDLPQEHIDKMDLWQYGQHFGLPSPLLDWTYSPYVALFFALAQDSSIPNDSKRCVWVINLELIDMLNRLVVDEVRPKFKDSLSPEELLNEQFPVLPVAQEINENNRRIAFQQGFFTKHEYYRSLEVWLTRIVSQLNMKSADRPVLHKYVFKCTELERIATLDKLDKMNINNRTLFPDIFGSVNDAVDSTFRGFRAPRFKSYSFGV